MIARKETHSVIPNCQNLRRLSDCFYVEVRNNKLYGFGMIRGRAHDLRQAYGAAGAVHRDLLPDGQMCMWVRTSRRRISYLPSTSTKHGLSCSTITGAAGVRRHCFDSSIWFFNHAGFGLLPGVSPRQMVDKSDSKCRLI